MSALAAMGISLLIMVGVVAAVCGILGALSVIAFRGGARGADRVNPGAYVMINIIGYGLLGIATVLVLVLLLLGQVFGPS
jgi:hypothetical protein